MGRHSRKLLLAICFMYLGYIFMDSITVGPNPIEKITTNLVNEVTSMDMSNGYSSSVDLDRLLDSSLREIETSLSIDNIQKNFTKNIKIRINKLKKKLGI